MKCKNGVEKFLRTAQNTLGFDLRKVVRDMSLRFLFLFVLGAFLSVSCSGVRGHSSVPSNTYGSLARSVVVILNNGRPSCTGFFISTEEIITATHCLDDRVGQTYEVVGYEQYLYDDTLRTSDMFYVVEADRVRDVALLRTWMAGAADYEHTVVELYDGAPPAVGTRTLSIGHPVGQLFTATTGFISRRATMDPETLVMLLHSNTPIYFGNSGGPLFDEDGRVIGMADMIVARQAFLGLFVSYSEIREFLMDIGYGQEMEGGVEPTP